MNNDSVIDHDNINNTDNSQLQATTSNIARTNGGYYLHPPDIILPPDLDLSSESGSNRASLQIPNTVTTSASGSYQSTNGIKSEYENKSTSLPTTSTPISSHLVFFFWLFLYLLHLYSNINKFTLLMLLIIILKFLQLHHHLGKILSQMEHL